MASPESRASSTAPFEVIAVPLATKPSGGSTLAIKRPTDTTSRSSWLQMGSQSQLQDPGLALPTTGACINAPALRMPSELSWKAMRLSIYIGIQPTTTPLVSQLHSQIHEAVAGCPMSSGASTKLCPLSGSLLSSPLAGHKSSGLIQPLAKA